MAPLTVVPGIGDVTETAGGLVSPLPAPPPLLGPNGDATKPWPTLLASVKVPAIWPVSLIPEAAVPNAPGTWIVVKLASVPRRKPWSPVASWNVPTIDRKSTRLNSSHSQISYAVFCLKKKKKQKKNMRRQEAIKQRTH